VAYAIGFAAAVPFFVLPGVYTGAAALRLGSVDIAWAVGLVVATLAYLVPWQSRDIEAEKAAVVASERELTFK
jgi:purine-cytosine permease-like protein